MRQLVERLREIKKQQAELGKEKDEIINQLPDKVIYKSDKPEDVEKPYIRFTKTDNLIELQEEGSIYRAIETYRYTTKLEQLKNEPKGE